jgi:hypothetical protein
MPLRRTASLGHNSNVHVLGKTQDLRRQAPVREKAPVSTPGPHEKDLCNAFASREIHEHCCCILTLQYSRFDMKIPRKIQMPFDRFAFLERQVSQVAGLGNVNSKAFRS